MIRFIWQNWWRRKERFFLNLVGVLIISVGLTYLVGLAEMNKGTIVDELQKRWKSSYDIVVRPKGTKSITEEMGLLDPNYLSGISGGISQKQYETIKNLPNVDVAAPIATIVDLHYYFKVAPYEYDGNGIYRLNNHYRIDDGIQSDIYTETIYLAFGDWNVLYENLIDKPEDYPIIDGIADDFITIPQTLLLAAIDPEQEAKLVGLDEAIIDIGSGRYFNPDDKVHMEILPDSDTPLIDIPIIMSNHSYSNHELTVTFEKLDIPFERKTAEKTLQSIIKKGGEAYLDTLPSTMTKTYSLTSKEIFNKLMSSISGFDTESGKPVDRTLYLDEPDGFQHVNLERPSALQYANKQSPYSERWPIAFQLKKIQYDDAGYTKESFREMKTFAFNLDQDSWPYVRHRWIGFYDPSKLTISKDPTNELPMETYRPANSKLVLDKNLKPINPPFTLIPSNSLTNDALDFIAEPPVLLTTLEAAEAIVGDKPISAIRIKVKDVNDLSEDSQAKVEKVAEEIKQKTGLMTDITLGSSPQPTLINVPAINDREETGWFEQPWVKLGTSITIFREARIGFSGLILTIMAVAIIYVWASSLVSLLSRRKEFAVLLAVGWKPSQLSRLFFLQSLLLGLAVALISWTMLGWMYFASDATVDPFRFTLTGLIGFLIYVLGAIIPAFLAIRIQPYEAMQVGEISKTGKRLIRTSGIGTMAFNHFIGKWRRSLLSIVAIALPTSLLALFLYITFRLRGVMYTTWLGQYVALEIGPVHYTSMIVALVIAILTTAEMMWQNISERQVELSLLKALGWKNRHIRYLIWIEGFFTGLFAAIIGLLLATGMMWLLYQQLPTDDLWLVLSTGAIPIVVGILGTVIPAERAVNMSPIRGMHHQYSNKKIIKQLIKWTLIIMFFVILSFFVYLIVQLT